MQTRGEIRRRRFADRRSGFTLIEIAIVVVIIGVISAMTLPNVTRYQESARARAAAKSVADAFALARAQAIRTGANHVVFFAIGGAGDTAGTALASTDGRAMPILVLNDGRPGTANQNCEIDAGEERFVFEAQTGVGWGFNAPTTNDVAPDETSVSGFTTIPAAGSTLRLPNGTATTWVQFRPDGVPVAIDASCNPDRLGSGGGSIYLWSTNRDFAVTLSPLGGVRVHTWDRARGGWTT